MDVLILTAVDYRAGLRQRTHHLMKFLTEHGSPPDLFYYTMRACPDGVEVFPEGPAVLTGLQLRDNYHLFNPAALADLIKARLRRRYPVTIAQGPTPGKIALQLKAEGYTDRVLYEDLDYFPGFYPDGSPFYRQTVADEKLCLQQADAVITVSPELAAYRQRRLGIRPQVSPNGVDYRFFRQVTPVNNDLTLVYCGSLEPWAGVGTVLEAMALLQEVLPQLKFIVAGSGSQLSQLRQQAAEQGLTERVEFLGQVTYQELPTILAQGKIGLVPFQPSRLTELAWPLKLMEYLAAGLPVVVSSGGTTARLVRGAGCGEIANGSGPDLARAIKRLVASSRRLNLLGERGRQLASHYDWPMVLAGEWELLQRLAGEDG